MDFSPGTFASAPSLVCTSSPRHTDRTEDCSTTTISGPRDDQGWERLPDSAKGAKRGHFGACKGLKLLHTHTKSRLKVLPLEASDAGNQKLRCRRNFQGQYHSISPLADLNFQPSPANFLLLHFFSSLRPRLAREPDEAGRPRIPRRVGRPFPARWGCDVWRGSAPAVGEEDASRLAQPDHAGDELPADRDLRPAHPGRNRCRR